MDILRSSFRWGLEHIGETNADWLQLVQALEGISAHDVVRAKYRRFIEWMQGKSTPPVGGQQVINELIDTSLVNKGWEHQVYTLGSVVEAGESDKGRRVAYWTMDFKKNDIGVEVSFNNAGVLAQNLLRLSVMSENPNRPKNEAIRLGILVTATEGLKRWANMDSTVLTFETVNRVLPQVNFNIPTPIIVLGLEPATNGEAWGETSAFGHKKLPEWKKLSASEVSFWRDEISKMSGVIN